MDNYGGIIDVPDVVDYTEKVKQLDRSYSIAIREMDKRASRVKAARMAKEAAERERKRRLNQNWDKH